MTEQFHDSQGRPIAIPPDIPTKDVYWHLAYHRQVRWLQKYGLANAEDTAADFVLDSYSFTNPYRANDRVSQYLINDVQAQGPQDPENVFFRTLLFKFFNKIETWEHLLKMINPRYAKEDQGAVPTIRNWNAEAFAEMLELADTPFGSAYMNPMWNEPPGYTPIKGVRTQLSRAINTVDFVIQRPYAERLYNLGLFNGGAKDSLAAIRLLEEITNVGPFLSYQLLTDLGYHSDFIFPENFYTCAGPQAIEGIAQAFGKSNPTQCASIIEQQTEQQEYKFEKLGLPAISTFGRRLQLIDCQNLFCELVKYIRLSERVERNLVYYANNKTKRRRIYRPTDAPPKLGYPNNWGVNNAMMGSLKYSNIHPRLFPDYKCDTLLAPALNRDYDHETT